MTLVNIDLRNQGYETGPDDRVVFYSLLVREGDFGTISTAPVEVELVDGKATVDLAPGPVGVQIIAGQVADTRVREGRVPMEGPTTLNVVLTLLPEYSDAVRASFLAAIRGAQDEALTRIDAEVAVAVGAEMGGVTAMSEEALSRAKAAAGVAATADAKSTSATSTASTAISTASNAATRVTALEAMSGLSPESPVDGQTANLMENPETLTNASIRAIVKRGTGSISVRDFGAVGDGVTDDTDAIQAALDAVDHASGITMVKFPPGTYMIDGVNYGDKTYWGQSGDSPASRAVGAGILPKAGTHLKLSPGAVLKVIPTDSPSSACIFLGKGQDGVTIEGGVIEGDREEHDFSTFPDYPTHEWGYGIWVRGAKDILIDRVRIQKFSGDGIAVAAQGMMNLTWTDYCPAERVRITGCSVDGSRRNNISATGARGVIIEGCEITRAGYHDGIADGVAPRYGIDLENYGEGDIDYEEIVEVIIRNNNFRENVNSAASSWNGYRVIIDGNHSDGPIDFGYATETIISNNVLVDPTKSRGVAINTNRFGDPSREYPAKCLVSNNVIVGFRSGMSIQRANVLVEGNSITDFSSTGISVTVSDGVTVTGNRILNGVGAGNPRGCSVADWSKNVTFSANDIRNVRTGVFIGSHVDNAVIAENNISQVYQAIAMTPDSEATIKGNQIRPGGHPDGQSHNIQWGARDRVTVVGNILHEPSSPAMHDYGATIPARLFGNKIIDSTASRMVDLSSARSEIVDNIFISKRSASVTAIQLSGPSGGTLISGNHFYHSGDSQINQMVSTSGATNVKVVGNYLEGSGDLVSGTGSGTATLESNIQIPS